MEQKLSFKKRLLILVTLSAMTFGFAMWLFLKPEYEYHYYKLNDCNDSYLTAIIYWKHGERGGLQKGSMKICLLMAY
ncbi:MAG: hypothetical protein COW65_16870 [Cytophagales bacterium CG18_big_fil_WC_8_21_14_2_50_42_9]|nr:MAG: hypothetical protein COW65_16870 [Cytophagales bacterium CG18_big_fil_WC_8_21_14_2_50_42_9]